ncbi:MULTISPECIES: acyltransferase domain-containing protein, partial [Streptomyces]
VPLVLSAKSPQALREQASALSRHLRDHPEEPLHHTAHTLACHRTHHPYRTAATGTRNHLIKTLNNTPTHTRARPTPPGITALYTGQGSQHPGMGQQLAHHFPAYAHALDQAAQLLQPHLDQPLHHLMWHTDPHTLNQTQYAQPTLWAHQTALTHLWHTLGITFTHTTGHSTGEIAAATLAGILTPQDAATLITTRAHLMQNLPHTGTMLTIQATP